MCVSQCVYLCVCVPVRMIDALDVHSRKIVSSHLFVQDEQRFTLIKKACDETCALTLPKKAEIVNQTT